MHGTAVKIVNTLSRWISGYMEKHLYGHIHTGSNAEWNLAENRNCSKILVKIFFVEFNKMASHDFGVDAL
jgi:hypothetical protein